MEKNPSLNGEMNGKHEQGRTREIDYYLITKYLKQISHTHIHTHILNIERIDIFIGDLRLSFQQLVQLINVFNVKH